MPLSSYMKQFGSSYYRGNLFFPPHIRHDVYTLYAFVRIPDNIVDDSSISDTEAKNILVSMQQQFTALYQGKNISSSYEAFPEASQLFHQYDIPLERANAFFAAMIQDTTIKRYETYAQLQGYMYGSAEVIGMMMCKIIGCDEQAYLYARQLGEAMQYTNFLRDVQEDYICFGRMYLPLDRLAIHGLSHEDVIVCIENHDISPALQHFFTQEITETKKLYMTANQGIQYLAPHGRFSVKLASDLYAAILDKIMKNNCLPYKNHRTNRWEKGKILASSRRKYAMTAYIN